ncbi:MAG: COX15/CtaA family protein [Thiolinea sp.]
MNNFYTHFLRFTLLLALVVIVLGAYTRLSDAGLGCPDWPGCYGHLTVPADASHTDFERPLEHAKAWAEMIHRYVAGCLGLAILAIFLIHVFKAEVRRQNGLLLPTLLLGTVIFQALLGMWTVTKLLSPIIVTGHLIGGFSTLSLLWLLYLRHQRAQSATPAPNHSSFSSGLRWWAAAALLAVIIQIILGGWTSTNYAAIACGTSYPSCHGSLWPEADFAKGFSLKAQMEAGVNYEFGILESPARTAIHMTHRTFAWVVVLAVGLLGIRLLRRKIAAVGHLPVAMLALLGTQVTLGILNVVLALPLAVATAHNLVAALLLLSLIAVNYRLFTTRNG